MTIEIDRNCQECHHDHDHHLPLGWCWMGDGECQCSRFDYSEGYWQETLTANGYSQSS